MKRVKRVFKRPNGFSVSDASGSAARIDARSSFTISPTLPLSIAGLSPSIICFSFSLLLSLVSFTFPVYGYGFSLSLSLSLSLPRACCMRVHSPHARASPPAWCVSTGMTHRTRGRDTHAYTHVSPSPFGPGDDRLSLGQEFRTF